MKKISSLIIIFIFSITLLGEELPVMLKVKSDFDLSSKIISTFRSGAEDSLTSKDYILISKEQQDEALMQQKEQQNSDCYDDACLVTTGKMMAARMIFIVDINKVKEEYLFKARLVDLESGSTKRTVTKIYTKDISIASDLLLFAKDLTNEVLFVKIKEKTVKKEVLSYVIKVKTNPSKAYIYYNNVKKGLSDLEFKILTKDKKKELRIEKDGYVSKLINIYPEKSVLIDVKLKELKKYTVLISIDQKNTDFKLKSSDCDLKLIAKKQLAITSYENTICEFEIKKERFYDINSKVKITKGLKINYKMLENYNEYFKIYSIANINLSHKLLYASTGVGVGVLDMIKGKYRLSFGLAVHQNLTDNYLYYDIYGNLTREFFKGFNAGLGLLSLIGEDLSALMGGLVLDYRYDIIKDIFIKTELKTGVIVPSNSHFIEKDLFFLITGISIGWNGF